MTRITKLTDYGIVLLSCLAREAPGTLLTATELAARAQLPAATASKLCKQLTGAGLLLSHRGVRGGYSLNRPPMQISMAEVIGALEGPVSLTECGTERGGRCRRHHDCTLRSNWQRVNEVVRAALTRLTLADMVVPLSDERLVSLTTSAGAPI